MGGNELTSRRGEEASDEKRPAYDACLLSVRGPKKIKPLIVIRSALCKIDHHFLAPPPPPPKKINSHFARIVISGVLFFSRRINV